jgi:hypothetical protein
MGVELGSKPSEFFVESGYMALGGNSKQPPLVFEVMEYVQLCKFLLQICAKVIADRVWLTSRVG